jgi:ribosomal-protein-alanine N-acetyltransferase
MVATLRSEARAGRVLPFIVTYEGRLVGQLTLGGVTYGSLRAAHMGYWVDQAVAGRGVIPTAAALAADHAFDVLRLHRLEIAMRPENFASQRVAEKLGFRFEGIRPAFLHIDGDWRDHRVYALHATELPGGVLTRWRAERGAQS